MWNGERAGDGSKLYGVKCAYTHEYGDTHTVCGGRYLELSCEGMTFSHWIDVTHYVRKVVMPGDELGPIREDYVLEAAWKEITAADVNAGEPEEGAAPADPEKTAEKVVTLLFRPFPLEEAGCSPEGIQRYDYVAGTRYDWLPTISRDGYVFLYWGGGSNGETPISEDSIVPNRNCTLWAHWTPASPTEGQVRFWSEAGDDPVKQCVATRVYTIGAPFGELPPAPARDRYRFLYWQTTFGRYDGGGLGYRRITPDTVFDGNDVSIHAVWEENWADWTRNRFSCERLSALVDGCPAEIKSVKDKGLAAGLKVVQEKTTKEWYVEGVPTELVDYATRDMFVEITPKSGAAATYRVKVRVVEDPVERMRPACVFGVYGMLEYDWPVDPATQRANEVPADRLNDYVMASDVWPEATKDWKFAGLPKGFGFSTKDGTKWTDVNKSVHYAPAGAVYGSSAEPVAAAVTATRTVKGVAGGSYTESYRAELEVVQDFLVQNVGIGDAAFRRILFMGADGLVEGVVGENVVVTLTQDWLRNNGKAKASNLPSGLLFTSTAKQVKVNGADVPVPAGSVYGTLNKETLQTAKISDGANTVFVEVRFSAKRPNVQLEYGAAAGAIKKMALLKPGADAKKSEYGTPVLVQGSAFRFGIDCDAGAKVTVKGQPTGMKLVQNKDKNSRDYGKWTLEGVPSKAGDYVAVFTVTQNGVSTSITERYVVKENRFAGEYRGTIVSSPAAGEAPRAGTIVVNVAAAGSTKVTVSEDGKSTLTYSAKSIGYSEANDYAYLEFELKPTAADKKLGYGVRTGRVTIRIPDASNDDRAEYRRLDGVVRFEDGSVAGEIEGVLVAAQAHDAHLRDCWFFTWSDGVQDFPIATIERTVKPGKTDVADIAGRLYDGTAIKLAKVPFVRDVAGDLDADRPYAGYSTAPFAVKAKDGRTFVFHGLKLTSSADSGFEGFATFADEEGVARTVAAETADLRTNAAMPFNAFFSSRWKDSLMTFDYGYDGFEAFDLDHGRGGDCFVLDADGADLAKIASKVQIALDGSCSFSFTTADKVYTYQVSLVTAPKVSEIGGERFVSDSRELHGTVVRSWKEGKETKSVYGIVDFIGVTPAE